MTADTPRSGLGALAPVLFLALVLLVATFVGLARYTSLLDRPFGVGDALPTAAMHTGAGPCLRYPEAPTAHSTSEAARALIAAGLSPEDLTSRVGDLYARAEAEEAKRHPQTLVEEHLESMRASSSLPGRLVVFVKRDRLRTELARVLAMTVPPGPTLASLPEAGRAAFEAQWARDPKVFVLPGLLELSRALKVEATQVRLDTVLRALEAQVARGESPSLEALGLPAAELQDGWGNALALERAENGRLQLISFGADRELGGSGADADLARELAVEAPPEAPPPQATCDGATELELPRAEVDVALEQLEALSREVRVVPALESGVMTGFRLLKVKPGFFTRVGLCEGDLVRTVNGLSLTSPERALELYSSLREAKTVKVELTRAGQPVMLVVRLR